MKIETRILFFFANQKDLQAEQQAVAFLDDWLSDGWVVVAELFHNDTVYIRLERKLDTPPEEVQPEPPKQNESLFTSIAKALVEAANEHRKVTQLIISTDAFHQLEGELRLAGKEDTGNASGSLTRVLGLKVVKRLDTGNWWFLA